jgi:hypothetical protein
MPNPDWAKTIDEQLTVKDADRTPRRSMAVNYPTELYALVLAASKNRGMTATAYQRRASLAFACHDLGLPISVVAVHEPPTAVTGPWEIQELS